MLVGVPEYTRGFPGRNWIPTFNLDAERKSWCIIPVYISSNELFLVFSQKN